MPTTPVGTPDPDHQAGTVLPFPARPTHSSTGSDSTGADTPSDAVPGRVPHAPDGAGHRDAAPASPTRQGPGHDLEPTDEVVDAELMSPAEEAALEARRRSAGLAVRQAAQVARVVRVGATHPHTRAAARVTVRTVVTVGQGHASWVKRATDALTHAHVREQIRSARAAGDREALAEWTDRLSQLKHARADRLRGLPAVLKSVAITLAVVVTVLAGMLLVAGVAFQLTPGGMDWAGWWQLLGDIAGVLGILAAVAVHIALWGTVPAVLWAAWREGRRRAEPPRWVMADPPGGSDRDVIPDENAIFKALCNLNLPALNRKVKQGWRPRWVQGSAHDGRGWQSQLLLPEGVTVEMIVDRKDVLAHNLLRLPVEVWPTEPRDKPGVLDLWVADPGSLTKPVEPWPLLREGTADYFKGVPVGIDPRGRTVRGRLFQANWGVAGMMGSGKSTLIITTLLGAMLDPLVEIDVYCMAYNADYDPLAPRLRTLFKSDDPEQIPVVLDALKKLMSELSERGRVLSEVGEPKLTRKIAAADPRMRPRVVVIDECQELFVSEHGEEAAELVEKIVAKARKYGVTLIFATPVPSADSLPRKVAKVLSNRAAFAIADHQGNDAILGTGKHKAGITATTLRPMTEDGEGNVDLGDIGTCMTVGFMPADSLMRCYYPRRGDGVDEVTPVVKRALAMREGSTDTTPAIEKSTVADPLADIATVLGQARRMPTQEVLHRLVEHDPDTYREWTTARLTQFLAPLDAAPYKSHGTMQVSSARVHEALTERDEAAETEGTSQRGAE